MSEFEKVPACPLVARLLSVAQGNWIEALIGCGIAKHDDAGMRGDSMIGRLNLHGAIELGLEKVALVFTYRVTPYCVCVGCG